jgi:hypothetical protein
MDSTSPQLTGGNGAQIPGHQDQAGAAVPGYFFAKVERFPCSEAQFCAIENAPRGTNIARTSQNRFSLVCWPPRETVTDRSGGTGGLCMEVMHYAERLCGYIRR